jgi:uncharacterized BrkB/YihY/UPF0761 family membrane protein
VKFTELLFHTDCVQDDVGGRVYEARERPPAKRRRLAALSTMLGVMVVVVVAASVVGSGRAIDWLGNYLIPVLVVLGVIVGVFGLAAYEIAKLHDKHKQPW